MVSLLMKNYCAVLEKLTQERVVDCRLSLLFILILNFLRYVLLKQFFSTTTAQYWLHSDKPPSFLRILPWLFLRIISIQKRMHLTRRTVNEFVLFWNEFFTFCLRSVMRHRNCLPTYARFEKCLCLYKGYIRANSSS